MNQPDCLSDGEILTVVVKSWNVDPNIGPSRNLEYGRLTSLVSNGERCVFGAVLRDDRYLG